ncbi:MAG TPA: hypothetical protein VMV05_03255 [bacterium]|nr:hypothetical protein [bacterium]
MTRRLSSYILMAAATVLFISSFALLGAGLWGKECEVSQVMERSHSFAMPGKLYANLYRAAVTPLAPNQMAQVCPALVVTPDERFNLLDRKIRLLPLEELQFAYYESPGSKACLYLLLGFGVTLIGAAFLLFQDKD